MKSKTKKVLMVAITLSIVATLAGASLLTFFGKIENTMNVAQSVTIDGQDWNTPIEFETEAQAGCCYSEGNFLICNNGCEGIWLDWDSNVWDDPWYEGIDMKISVIPEECDPEIILPPRAILNATHWGTNAYFDTVLSHIPAGYTVEDGLYNGWCVNQGTSMVHGEIQVTLWNSYDPASPWLDDDWDMVNWIINNKGTEATLTDIQQAIWFFVNGGHEPSNPAGIALRDAALANGEGFYPEGGELIAILCDCGPDCQRTFIEVEVPECEVPEECCDLPPMRLPFYLDAGECIEVCISYDLDMLLAPNAYNVWAKLVPATQLY